MFGARGAARRGRLLYGALDLGFAALYAWLGFAVAPGRSPIWNVALASLVALLAASGGALLVGARFARPLAIITQTLLLVFCATTIVLLVASAAYLRGIYGPIGQGLAMVSLLIAALIVEGCGLLPMFQLRFLLQHTKGCM